MKVITVRCNECGAPLETSDTARYLTCGHCGSQLSVQRTASAVFTEKLDAIASQTEMMAGSLGIIRVQNDIAQLDREWVMEREKHLIRGKRGVHEPNFASIFGGTVGLVVGLLMICGGLSMHGSGSLALVGLIFAVFSGSSMVSCVGKVGKLKAARETYEFRRAELLAELERLR